MIDTVTRCTRATSRVCATLALLAAAAGASAQSTTYTYSGKPYVSPNGAFTTSMRVTGSFTTANPLPANMPPTAIGPAGDGRAIAWSFSNGIDMFTQATSSEFSGDPNYFVVGTDGAGNVIAYNIALATPLPPHAVNDLISIALFSNTTDTLQAVRQSACVAVTSGYCTNLPFGGVGWLNEPESGGAFLKTAYASIPADSAPALAATAALVAIAALAALARRTAAGHRA